MPHKHCGGTPKPIAVWGIHFSIRPQKKEIEWFQGKINDCTFQHFINIEPWEPGLVQNRTENQNKFAKETGVSKHGTISHFAIAKTGHGFNWNWGSLFGLNCVGLRTWNQ